MEKRVIILSELIEHCGESGKLLIANAIAMENGEVAEAQKLLKEATNMLKVMIKDVFVEVKEIFGFFNTEEDEYDYSVLDLAKLLIATSSNAGSLINCLMNNEDIAVEKIIKSKLSSNINAVESLANAILLN